MTTQTPKLLTEAEARGAWQATYSIHAMSITDYFAQLRERGLIAEEPVDPLLVEAREIEATNCEESGFHARARQIRSGEYDDGPVRCILLGLRRGMELAPRKELTRDRLDDALEEASVAHLLTEEEDAEIYERRLTRLHAALTEALQ